MKKYSRIIALLLAVALVLPGAGLAAKAEEDANEVHRLYGANRYETAVEVSKEAYPTTAKNVILASGESSVDALTGTSLAGKLDAPILYTTKGELHAATKAQLKALGAETVHLLGGPGVISEAVKTELEGLSYKVERISGQDRAKTAVEVARKLGATHTRAYVVTDGLKTALADALAVAPVSHMLEAPVFLTGQAGLTPATKAALEEFGVTHVTIIGGEVAVSTAVETELKSLVTVNRIKGGTRAETAVKIAEELFTTAPTKAVLANGWKNDLVDALAGGYLGGKMVAPILYATKAGALEKATEEYLDTTFTDVYVLGGTGVVTTAAEKAALEAISPLEVKSVSAINAKEVEIKFSKAVDESTVVTSGSPDTLNNITFTLVGAGQSITSGSAEASLSEDGKTLTVVATTGEYFDGQYAVLVPVAVTDEDGNAVEAYSQILTVKDTTRPTIGAATYPNNNAVKFAFSEPVNLANGAALEAISTLKDKDGAIVSNSSLITLSADKKSFELNMSGLTAKETYTLTIVGAEDFAGNLITPNPVTVTFVKANADTVDPKVVSVEAVNDTNLIVTFSEAIKDTAGTFFKLDIATTGAVPITATEAKVSDDKTEFNINLKSTALSTLKAVASGLKRVDITGFQDLSGNPTTATDSAYNKLITFTADTDEPEVKATTVETIAGVRYIVVEFNEDVTVTPAALPTVTYVADGVQKTLAGGIDVAAVSAHDKDNDGNDDSIKINTEDYDGVGTVNLLPEGAYTITLPASLVADAAANNNVATDVKVTVGKLSSVDVTKPGISSVTVTDNDTVTVVFSEEVSNETALNTANYTIDGVKVVDSAIFQGDKTTVKLTLKDGIIGINGGRLFEIKNVADKAGNVMNAYSDTKTFTENVKPQMLSAQIVDTDKVLVTFSEGLLASSIATGDFTVKVNGTAVTVSTVQNSTGGSLANGDTKVLVTFTPAITATSDVVTVEIADGVIDDVNSNSNNGAKTVTATN